MKQIILLIATMLTAFVSQGQIDTDQTMRVGQNALYFEDYMLSIQYFNRVIGIKPYLAQPYLLRAIAKLNLDDYAGAEADATEAIDRNPYLPDAWEVRGVARQNLGKALDAVPDYDRALSLLPNNRGLMFNKALAQHDGGDAAGADTTFAALIEAYPRFEPALLGRARLRMTQADTVAALDDITRALEINPKAANGYILRADIDIARGDSLERAEADLSEAIRLTPRVAGLYVNRAYVRYRLDKYYGAMADFDYAIELDPLSEVAIFNRSLLEMETAANDRALNDLDRLIAINPGNTRARYNRAIVNSAKGRHAQAVEDIGYVIAEVPELPDPYYMRSQFYRDMGDMRHAEADYRRATALAHDAQRLPEGGLEVPKDGQRPAERTSDEAARRFASLLTVDDNAQIAAEHNNNAIRGRVQDQRLNIEPLGWLELTYYPTRTELRPDTYYIKDVDRLNATRLLRMEICVSAGAEPLDDQARAKHLESIYYYNSYLSTHTPRSIDYIGRGMDFMSLADYDAASADFERALALTPDHPAVWLLLAQARYHGGRYDDALAALERAQALQPSMAEPWYERAVILIGRQNFNEALVALDRAITLRPDLAEAWYNRAYVNLHLGHERRGTEDLSQAGALGVLPAYNLLKRISK